MHVLITRPLRDAQMTAQALRARGHEVLISPVLEIIGTGASIATTSGGPWDGVIATSAQAFDYLDTEGRATIQHLPMFVVGTRTAQAAHNTGFKDIRIIAPHASELVTALAKQAPQHFLYLAGQDRKSDLEGGLAASGHTLTALVVYEARAATGLSPQALGAMREGRLDAVLHYSRRSAALFAQLVQQAGLGEELYRLRHVCISRDAADGMSQHCVIAKSPDQEGLFAALELG
jgi:uroporphyrinogen-III synthase